MGKLRSNRVKRTPQLGITSDRYTFLGLEQAEPNLGDPKVGPSSVGANPIKSGTPYQLVSIVGHEGERFWTPSVGIGTTFGVISVYVNGALAGNDNRFSRIHGLDFVGTGVTIETPPVEFGDGVGIATVRFTVIDQKNVDTVGQIVYNSPTGLLSGADDLVYYNSNIGIGTTLPKTRLDVVGSANITGIVTAGSFSGTATTAINVSGGTASVTSLSVIGGASLQSFSATNASVSGVVTATTFIGNLQGNATSSISVNGGTANITSLTVTGASSVGFITGTDAYYTGIVTANRFVTLGDTSLDNVIINKLTVTGITTLGITTTTNLFSKSFNVSGVSTFNDNVDIRGTLVGPAVFTIDPAAVGDNTGKVVIKGNLEVLGTQTTIDSETVVVKDKNIELAVTTSPSDTTADGGGIIVKGNSDHSILFDNGEDAWKFTEHLLPNSNLSNSLGSSSYKWNQLYVNSTNIISLNSTNLNVTGVSTLGFTSGTNAYYTGIVTATTFYGDIIGGTITGNIIGSISANAATATTAINVVGGIASITSLSVSGTSTLQSLSATNGNFTGIVTASSFVGSLQGNATTSTTSTNVIGGIASVTQLSVSGVTTVGFLTGTSAYYSGIVTASKFYGEFIGNIADNVATATTAVNVIGGIASVTSLIVSGTSTLQSLSATNGNFTGIVTANSFVGSGISVSGVSTIANLRITPVGTGATVGSVGVVTYYGDGSKLSGISSAGNITVYRSYPTLAGIVTTIDFGPNLNVSTVSSGIVTITTSQLDNYWVKTSSGIHTLSNVGVGTTNPIHPLQVGISGTSVIVVDNSGELGIGTTFPSQKLHVIGNGLFSGGVTASEFTSTSDLNLKNVIGNINSPLEKILKMNGVEFTWKSSGANSIGVIAQDIESIIPELVVSYDEIKTVNYNGLIAVLIEAIKDQQSQISELRARIDT